MNDWRVLALEIIRPSLDVVTGMRLLLGLSLMTIGVWCFQSGHGWGALVMVLAVVYIIKAINDMIVPGLEKRRFLKESARLLDAVGKISPSSRQLFYALIYLGATRLPSRFGFALDEWGILYDIVECEDNGLIMSDDSGWQIPSEYISSLQPNARWISDFPDPHDPRFQTFVHDVRLALAGEGV